MLRVPRGALTLIVWRYLDYCIRCGQDQMGLGEFFVRLCLRLYEALSSRGLHRVISTDRVIQGQWIGTIQFNTV